MKISHWKPAERFSISKVIYFIVMEKKILTISLYQYLLQNLKLMQTKELPSDNTFSSQCNTKMQDKTESSTQFFSIDKRNE